MGDSTCGMKVRSARLWQLNLGAYDIFRLTLNCSLFVRELLSDLQVGICSNSAVEGRSMLPVPSWEAEHSGRYSRVECYYIYDSRDEAPEVDLQQNRIRFMASLDGMLMLHAMRTHQACLPEDVISKCAYVSLHMFTGCYLSLIHI